MVSDGEKRKKEMKKLIIAASIACTTAIIHASTVNWGLSGALDTTKFASGTAYLILNDTLARPTLSADTAGEWYKANKGSLASSAFRTASVTDGAIYESEVIESPTGRKNYWIIIDNNATNEADHYFAVSAATKPINIQSGTMNQTATWMASSQMGTFAVVPEPTSGLLLLLGMAGLALKRKRA